MHKRFSAQLCIAGVLAMGVAVGAQGTSQQPSSTTSQPTGTTSQQPAGSTAQPSTATTSQGPSSAARSAAGQTMISGCVVSESDYRKMHNAGNGGVAGTGIGVGNEYILMSASNGPSSSAPTATGTSGSTASTASSMAMAYELTGSGEGQLSRFVGRRVELTGMFKAGEMGAAGQPTGGPTAGAPPHGVDVGGKDLKLREFEVASVKEATGDCPAMAR